MKLDTFLERLRATGLDGENDALTRLYAGRAAALAREDADADPVLEAALHFAAMQHEVEPARGEPKPLMLLIGADPGPWRRLAGEMMHLHVGMAPPDPAPAAQPHPLTETAPRAWRAAALDPAALATAWQLRVVAVLGVVGWARTEAVIEALSRCANPMTLLLAQTPEADAAAAEAALAARPDARLLSAPATRRGRLVAAEGVFAQAQARAADAKTIPAMKPFAGAVKPGTRGFDVRLHRTLPKVDRIDLSPGAPPATVIEARSAMTFTAPRRPQVVAAAAPPARTDELTAPRFDVTPLTLTTLRDGRFNGAGFVLDAEDGLLQDSFLPPAKPHEYTCWGRGFPLSQDGADGHVGFVDKRFIIQLAAGEFRPRAMPPAAPRRIKGPVLAVCGFYHQTYSHWLIDILPKLWALRWLEAAGLRDATVALPDPLSAKQREMLRLLGVDEERIALIKREEWVVADHLLVPSRPSRMYDFIAPEAFQIYDELAERALAETPVDVSRLPRRIYAAREAAAGRRRLLNEDEIVTVLERAGYAPVEFKDLSVAEEIALFRNAEAIAAPHGSALAGIAFMRPGARVCFWFFEELLRVVRHHFTITAHRDLDLVGVLGETFDARVDASPWLVDADLVAKAVGAEKTAAQDNPDPTAAPTADAAPAAQPVDSAAPQPSQPPHRRAPEMLDAALRELVRTEQDSWHFESIVYLIYRDWIAKPGSVAIDVGANKGVHTLRMAECVGPKGKVLAYEPLPELVAEIERQARARFGNAHCVRARQAALSDVPGEQIFHRHVADSRGSLIRVYPDEMAPERAFKTPVTTLDAILDVEKARWVSVLKIDAEGNEHRILEGGRRFFQTCGPMTVIEFSVSQLADIGKTAEDFFALCDEIGYAFYNIDGTRFDRDFVASGRQLNCYERFGAKRGHWIEGFLTDHMPAIVTRYVEQARRGRA